MFFTDNHIHSICSPDAKDTMSDMALAAYNIGVRRLCFTDHCDLDNPATGKPNYACYDFRDRMISMFRQAQRDVPADMELFLGLELGEGNHDPERMAEIAASEELDFVLATLHNLKDTMDFHDLTYTDRAQCEGILDRYMEELIEIAQLPSFDTMAHVSYPVRYMRQSGIDITMDASTHREQLEELFKTLILRGKGIEINCAGLRNPLLKNTIPTPDVLKLYRDLGGEIITVGSDAHRMGHVEVGVRQGFDILRELGYKYVTIFRERKPEFIKI